MKFWIALAAALALSWWSSSQPGDDLPGLFPHVDKLVHAAVWAVFAGLAAAGGLARGWAVRTAIVVACAIGLAYGIVDETHQSYVPRRDASAADVVADVVGAVLGSFAVARVYRRRRDGDPP